MRVETMRFKTTHTSTFGSTTTGVGTASITATTLGECTDTAADVVAEDAFVARVGHDCFKLCWEGRWDVGLMERMKAWMVTKIIRIVSCKCRPLMGAR